jgi:hypothetical protein
MEQLANLDNSEAEIAFVQHDDLVFINALVKYMPASMIQMTRKLKNEERFTSELRGKEHWRAQHFSKQDQLHER